MVASGWMDIKSQELAWLDGRCDIHPTMREMTEKLSQKKPLRIKYGIDPTGSQVHLGHTVPMRILQHFQKFGHQIVLIIGDFTARIGDPTGRSEVRRPLTKDEVEENSRTYLSQIGKVIDVSKAEVHRNSDWFNIFTMEKLIALANHITVQRLTERDDFKNRIKANKPVHFHELLYPLMQAYDSVVVKADIEVGGTEQLFTLFMARDFQTKDKQVPQICITVPLLRGTDGEAKMGKTLDNYIAVDAEPCDMFAKVMSIPDELMIEWFKLLTDLKDKVCLRSDGSIISPLETKRTLAWEITKNFYSREIANQAREEWHKRFTKREDPTNIPEIVLTNKQLEDDGTLWICKLLTLTGLTDSNTQARNLITPVSGVTIGEDRRKITDVTEKIKISDGLILRVGNRKIIRVRINDEISGNVA